MKKLTAVTTALGVSLLMAACGSGVEPPPPPPPIFTSMVSFGDSLSDVGTYNAGDVRTAGGGKYTVNGITDDSADDPASLNWTERIAAQLQLPAPCAAETGVAGKGFLTPTLGPVAPVSNTGCFNYAQGGARVTLPIGPGNLANGDAVSLAIGQLTVPVITQMQRHLDIFGEFSGTELVTVFAGANDVLQLTDDLTKAATAAGSAAFANSLIAQLAAGAADPGTAAQAIGLALQAEAARSGSDIESIVAAAVSAAAAQPGNAAVASPAVYGPMVTVAQTAGATAAADYAASHGPDLVIAMGTAGAELAEAINTQILGKGAKYVVVLNLPDVSLSPASRAQSAETQGLIQLMVTTFNTQLENSLSITTSVKLVDIYAYMSDQVANPATYGLTNVTDTACDMTKTAIVSPLLCTKDTLFPRDVSHYLFAESGGHPTPYELKLVAEEVARNMAAVGWTYPAGNL